MRSAPFWDFTHRRMAIYYRRFGTTQQAFLEMSSSLFTLKELIGKEVEEKSFSFKVLKFKHRKHQVNTFRDIIAVNCNNDTKIYDADDTELLVLRPVVHAETTVI
jgi:hypothetical protein